MSLLIIGEAVAKLMDRHLESANGRPDIPWHAMRGMCNRIAHGYFDIDFHVVWSTVQIALPELLERLTESPADPEPP